MEIKNGKPYVRRSINWNTSVLNKFVIDIDVND